MDSESAGETPVKSSQNQRSALPSTVDPLELKARRAAGKALWRESGAKAEYNPIVKLETTNTRGQAIKAMCAHCMGCTREEVEPGWRDNVRNCTSPACPLFGFRPFQDKSGG